MPTVDAAKIEIVEKNGGVEFVVKAVPGAARTQIAGVWGTALRLAVAAPPERGKANAALVEFLAGCLGVKRGTVQLLSGETQPLKRFRVTGLTASQARQRLAAAS